MDNSPIETALFKSHVMHSHPIYAMSLCTCNANVTAWYLRVSCMLFYPHSVHVIVFNIHIPISYSQKLYVIQNQENQHVTWIFFSSFPSQKNNMHIYQHYPHKTACYSTKKKIMQTEFFFSRFPAYKNNMHILTLSLQKLHVTQTRNNHANWILFFPDFQLRKTTCIY